MDAAAASAREGNPAMAAASPAIIIYLVFLALVAALGLWIMYAIIKAAVRNGVREAITERWPVPPQVDGQGTPPQQ